MISVELQGGVANVMYQIAFIESLGQKYFMDVCYPNFESHIAHLKAGYDWTRHADEYRNIFKNIDFGKNSHAHVNQTNRRHVPFHYTEIVPKDGDHFLGYFQSEKFFYSNAFIKWLFEPSDYVKSRLEKYLPLFNIGTTCSIHVRRGNYLTLSDIHPPLGFGYYALAIDEIQKTEDVDAFLIFSNDIEWCKSTFIGDKFIFIEDTDYVELYLGSMCTHFIIGNSSFSAWMAILGERDVSKVIAPEIWFGKQLPIDYAKDITPDRWIKI